MCERPETNPDVKVVIPAVVIVDHETPRLEVGPIFGSAKKPGQTSETVGVKTNEWFRQNGGI